jgi:hypothetical protein
MKKIFLIPILGIFVFALAITNSSNDNNTDLFLNTDNIAFAQETLSAGHSCKPRALSFCPVIGNGNAVGYTKVSPPKEIINNIN